MDEQISNRIFVGGISWKADESSLRDFFSIFGTVVDCKIIMDPVTNKSKGYGFVTFEDKETALQVKKTTKLQFMGKTMNVGDAYRKSDSQPKSRPPRHYNSYGNTHADYPAPVYQGGMFGYYPVYSDQLYYHPPYYTYYYQPPVYYDHLYEYGVPFPPPQVDQFNQLGNSSEFDRNFQSHELSPSHIPPTPMTPQFQSLNYPEESHQHPPQQHSPSNLGTPPRNNNSSSSSLPPGQHYVSTHHNNRNHKKEGSHHHHDESYNKKGNQPSGGQNSVNSPQSPSTPNSNSKSVNSRTSPKEETPNSSKKSEAKNLKSEPKTSKNNGVQENVLQSPKSDTKKSETVDSRTKTPPPETLVTSSSSSSTSNTTSNPQSNGPTNSKASTENEPSESDTPSTNQNQTKKKEESAN